MKDRFSFYFSVFQPRFVCLTLKSPRQKSQSDSSTRIKEKAEEPKNSLTSFTQNDLAVPVVLERIQKGNMRRNQAFPVLLLNEKKDSKGVSVLFMQRYW